MFGEGLSTSQYVAPRHWHRVLVAKIAGFRGNLVLGMMRGTLRYPFQVPENERLCAICQVFPTRSALTPVTGNARPRRA